VLLVLVALKNIQENLSVALVRLDLDLLHAEELNDDVQLLILLQSAHHRLNRKDLLSAFPDCEIELDRVLTLILQEQGLLLWLANSNGLEVEHLVNLHSFVQSNVECLCVEVDSLVLLLDAESLDVLNFEHDVLEELLLSDRFKSYVDCLVLEWKQSAGRWLDLELL